jgi:hypothetical protein
MTSPDAGRQLDLTASSVWDLRQTPNEEVKTVPERIHRTTGDTTQLRRRAR